MDNFLLHKTLWNDKCDYIHPDTCENLNMEKYNLIILQLNICGLLSHQDELKLLLHKLQRNISSVDIILLCETFLNNKTENSINMPVYTTIANNRQQTRGGGTAILIKDGLKFNRRKDLDILLKKKWNQYL